MVMDGSLRTSDEKIKKYNRIIEDNFKEMFEEYNIVEKRLRSNSVRN